MLMDDTAATVTISLQLNNKPWRLQSVDRFSTVLGLKELIASACGLCPFQQRLVFAGQLLEDEMSLDFYQITNNSRVYLLPIRQSRENPRFHLTRLTALISEASASDCRTARAAVAGIKSLLDNPVLVALSRIDDTVKSTLEEADVIVNGFESRRSPDTSDVQARAQDQLMSQFDTSPEGFRAMVSLLESNSESDEERFADPTRIQPAVRICERPLPTPWASKKKSVLYRSALRVSVGAREAPRKSVTFGIAKAKFPQQMAVLKDMGFSDEDRIMQALCETNGNVQLAAKRLDGCAH
jgi:hypothetical protein